MKSKRTIVLAAIGLLTLVFAVLGNTVVRELRSLSTAESDNLQWTILQVETEIANFHVVLAEASTATEPATQSVRLRADIALSRLGIVGRGQTAELFGDNLNAQTLVGRLASYSDSLIEILDRDDNLSTSEIAEMLALTQDIRPDARRLVLLALEAGTESAAQRRERFAQLLLQTAATAIALILGLAALLVLLDQLLSRMRRRDREIKASSARLASTVAASLDAIVTANEDGEIIEFNASAERIFGWSRDEVIGKKMEHSIIPHHHRAAHASGMERYLATREPHVVDKGRVELTALRKSGEEFPVELNITSVQTDSGTLFIAYLRDISARLINEQQLIDARDRAENMDRAKSQFLAVMSHEMRTPLNGILGVLDLLGNTDLDSEQDRYIRVAAASSEILLEQVNEALDIARIEMGSMTLSPQPFEMAPLMERVVDVLSPLAQEKGLELRLALDPGMARTFFGDGARIGQIITNLIGNAIKYTDHGAVTVDVKGIHGPDATAATIAVRDTGSGIPQDKLEEIFEDFVVLAHGVGRQSRGDGLGLSISRKVARLMGGDLAVQSKLKHGSSFVLNVPLSRATDGVANADTNAASGPDTPEVDNKSILIVEDNAINRSVLREMLESLGHNVSEAVNGKDGLSMAKKHAVDLIIMDISMPVMDGIEAVKHLRRDAGPNKHCHVVGLTAHGQEEYRDKAAAAGMDDFFTKPIRLATLRNLLSDLPAPNGAQTRKAGHIDRSVLEDLINVLGPEKVRQTADQFFAQMADDLSHLESSAMDAEAVAAALHKLRGGAGLLGLKVVVKQIDAVNAAELSTDDIQALRRASDDAQASLDAIGELKV